MKKLISLFTALCLVFTTLGTLTVFSDGTAATLNVGDYVQMGTYYDAPILWRCVSFEKIKGYDENGIPITDANDTVTEYKNGYLPLMLSDKIICCKAFDAMTNLNSTAGSNSETGSHSRRKRPTTTESNYWADSNIRSWLNSTASAGNVVWLCGNPPHQDDWNNVLWGGYENEAGFLTNFSENEQAIIKEVSQKCIVAESDKDLEGVTGSALHQYAFGMSEIVQNYDKAYSEQVKDTIFLPDVKQIDTVYKNGAMLGEDYFIPYPTEQAHEFAEQYGISKIAGVEQWSYMLRTPYCTDSSKSDTSIRKVCNMNGGYIGSSSASFGSSGVRPAFFADLTSAVFTEGDGTSANPYKNPRVIPYEINTVDDFVTLRGAVNDGYSYEDETVTLNADLDLSTVCSENINGELVSWAPIGTEENTFNGTFNGGSHTISGLYITSKSENTGLFGYTGNKATIRSLTVDGCINVNTDTNKSHYAGGIIAYNQGIVENCNNRTSISAVEAAPSGGIISGGIAGFNNGIIRRSANSGTVSSETYLIGGICGRNNGLIENCFNAGTVSGQFLIGGICAQLLYNGRIANCYNIGSAEGNDCVGEIVGDDRVDAIDNFYYCIGNTPDETISDIGTAKTAEAFNSGEVAYLLNNSKSDGELVWYQTIGEDDYPVLDSTHKAIMYDGERYYNEGVLIKEPTPNLSIDYINEKLLGYDGNFSNYIIIPNYDVDVIPINDDWSICDHAFGATLTIIKRGNGTTTTESDPQTLFIPQRPTAPEVTAVPVNDIDGAKGGKIKGVSIDMEYKLSTSDTWKDCAGTEITGLEPGTYFVRKKAADSNFASDYAAVEVLGGDMCVKITASYSGGILTDIRIENIYISQITEPKNTAERKTFYWESLESMKPIN